MCNWNELLSSRLSYAFQSQSKNWSRIKSFTSYMCNYGEKDYRWKQMKLNGATWFSTANCMCAEETVKQPQSITNPVYETDQLKENSLCNSHAISETIQIFKLITQIVPRSALSRIQHYASADKTRFIYDSPQECVVNRMGEKKVAERSMNKLNCICFLFNTNKWNIVGVSLCLYLKPDSIQPEA